jgi:hypothetical protein
MFFATRFSEERPNSSWGEIRPPFWAPGIISLKNRAKSDGLLKSSEKGFRRREKSGDGIRPRR